MTPDELKFWRDAIIGFGQVYAWPSVVLLLVVIYGRRMGRLVDGLLGRLPTAKKLKLFQVWEDELGEGLQPLLSGTAERVPTVYNEQLEEGVTPDAKVSAEVVLEPAANGETTRETVVRVVAFSAAQSFNAWRASTARNFPDDKTALLAWVAEVGAPQVMRSYEAFVALAKRLSRRYNTMPPPTRDEFEAQVAAYNRDNPV